ncbi:hypothetical protein MN116_002786 [Schistosoma mekongi]|uniref:Calpain catalytic domain-containing protein n=1 Tax=Schistosoma mekongi TaxID=38744 RepID=A0AAE1ZHE4_SCHME|nr:hypothetical protein MN116_002786 [Schistosoma mekongi]
MGCIQFVCSSDACLNGRDNNPGKEGVDQRSDAVVTRKPQNPDDYCPKHLGFNLYLPKTLTPKGYAKLKLMNISSNEYKTLVTNLNAKQTGWEDPDFPANESSIGDMKAIGQNIDWKRPQEIHPNARFFSDGPSRFDIKQGVLGDCWFLAVTASIASYPQLFDKVVPKNQELKGPDYVGAIRFRFWQFGQWVEVLIDDRLPVRSGSNELVFMHSSDPTEFWSALMEKAYAKLNGCYTNLSGGLQCEAMEDFTGGICLSIQLNPYQRPQDLIEQLKIYAQRCCLIGCNIYSRFPFLQKLDNGLISGHAYSLTGVHFVNYRGKTQWLMRIRNPWGDSHEWKGAWCDGAPEWSYISQQEKENILLSFNEDGEFWMSYEDFVTYFSNIEVCHLSLESLEYNQDFHGKRRLDETIFSGQWQRNVNAGGCISNRTTYWTNPQFRITVKDPDPDDDDNKCSILVGLMQKDIRKQFGPEFHSIGFMVYEIPDEQSTIMSQEQLSMKTPISKAQFRNTREVTAQFRGKPGAYVIIPSTFDPNIEAKFILRVYTQVANSEKIGIMQNHATLKIKLNDNPSTSFPFAK